MAYASTINDLRTKNNSLNNQHVIGFYGGQIRHFVDLQPQISIELIFPQFEPHFSVKMLVNQLQSEENLSITQCHYLHGFMNSNSTNFNALAYQYYLNKLKRFIRKV